MVFGISFGSKKQSTESNTVAKKTEAVTGSESQSTKGTSIGATNTESASSGQSAQQTNQQQNTNQSTTGQTTAKQTGTTTTLGSDIQSAVGDSVKKLLAGGVNDANIAGIANLIGGATNFNADQYIRDTVLGARVAGENALQESTSARQSQIGGTAGTNSMAALLAQRGRNDLEANLASITGQATANASEIQNKNLSTAVGAQGSLVSQAAGLGDVLKGATTTTDATTLQTQLQQLLGSTGTTGASTSQESQQQQQSSQTLQIIDQLVNALTKQNTSSQGYENTQGSTKSSGGGLSLGF